jgi:hypothetical protein
MPSWDRSGAILGRSLLNQRANRAQEAFAIGCAIPPGTAEAIRTAQYDQKAPRMANILVVDDDDLVRDLITTTLIDAGHEVRVLPMVQQPLWISISTGPTL